MFSPPSPLSSRVRGINAARENCFLLWCHCQPLPACGFLLANASCQASPVLSVERRNASLGLGQSLTELFICVSKWQDTALDSLYCCGRIERAFLPCLNGGTTIPQTSLPPLGPKAAFTAEMPAVGPWSCIKTSSAPDSARNTPTGLEYFPENCSKGVLVTGPVPASLSITDRDPSASKERRSQTVFLWRLLTEFVFAQGCLAAREAWPRGNMDKGSNSLSGCSGTGAPHLQRLSSEIRSCAFYFCLKQTSAQRQAK